MKSYFYITALLASLVFTSCENLGTPVTPSGEITTNALYITGFSGIDVSDAFNVTVQLSDSVEMVEIQSNENLHRYIEVTKKGQMLEIGVVNNVSIKGNATLNAIVTTKNLDQFYASGASVISVEDSIKEADIYIDLSGASLFKGALANNKISTGLSGASVLELAGNSNQFMLDMSGASVTKNFDFTCEHFMGDFSGASAASISITNTIHLDASGASTLNYKGEANIEYQDLSGGSSIHKVN